MTRGWWCRSSPYPTSVVECEEKDVEKAEAWLEKAIIDRMDEIVNGLKADGPLVPIEVEVESGKSWGGE